MIERVEGQIEVIDDCDQPEVPEEFAVTSDDAANWVIRKIIEARAYSERCEHWCKREQARAKRTEEFFHYRYGAQLMRWVANRIAEQGDRRKSINFPAGTAGYRRQNLKLVIEDEAAVLRWCKTCQPQLVVVVERLSKTAFNEYVKQTGDMPQVGVRVEPEHEQFYVK